MSDLNLMCTEYIKNRIQIKSFGYTFKFAGYQVKCLLCGVLNREEGRFMKHYFASHTVYGINRQCEMCEQYFFSVRNRKRHERSGRCPGKPALYCTSTGRLFYHGRTETSMVVASLCTRKTHHENALVSLCDIADCAEREPIEMCRQIHALSDLPLAHSNGRKPEFTLREFAPSLPEWRDPPHPVLSETEPMNREELNNLLAMCDMAIPIPMEVVIPAQLSSDEQKAGEDNGIAGKIDGMCVRV